MRFCLIGIRKTTYSSFGEIKKITDKNGLELSSPVLEHHFAYTGREYDEESNLYYYRARQYDPSIGRFIQIDPHPGKIGMPITVVNRYV
jgi:RHS repeat-associated protein